MISEETKPAFKKGTGYDSGQQLKSKDGTRYVVQEDGSFRRVGQKLNKKLRIKARRLAKLGSTSRLN